MGQLGRAQPWKMRSTRCTTQAGVACRAFPGLLPYHFFAAPLLKVEQRVGGPYLDAIAAGEGLQRMSACRVRSLAGCRSGMGHLVNWRCAYHVVGPVLPHNIGIGARARCDGENVVVVGRQRHVDMAPNPGERHARQQTGRRATEKRTQEGGWNWACNALWGGEDVVAICPPAPKTPRLWRRCS